MNEGEGTDERREEGENKEQKMTMKTRKDEEQ